VSYWPTLGIEPTGDLLAIKRAYAARLKRTRPDDDAAAYQALRSAYEFALQHARWAAQQPVPSPTAAAEPPSALESPEPPTAPEAALPQFAEEAPAPAAMQEAAAPEAEAESPPTPPSHVAPRELAHQTLHYLQESGPDALVAGWPMLERELDNLPLWERKDASNWFAQLVIDTEQMPVAFAHALDRYFAWGTDFRTEQQLGAPRAIALRERIGQMRFGFHASEAFRQRYAEISFFGQLVQQIASWRLHLFAILAPSRLSRLWNELAPRQRYALGVPRPPLHTRADHAIEVGTWVRAVAVLLLAATVLQLKSYAGEPWIERLFYVVFVGGGGVVLLSYGHRLCLRAKRSLHAVLRPAGLAPGLPKPSLMAGLALACMLAATAMCSLGEAGAWPAAFRAGFAEPVLVGITLLLIALAALLPRLPATEASPALPAILVLCVLAGIGLPGLERLPSTGACIGAAWFLAACTAHTLYGEAIEKRWNALKEETRRSRQAAKHSTMHNLFVALLWLLRVTIGWPYRLMLLGSTQSARFAVAVVGLSIVALPGSLRAWQMPFSAAVGGGLVLFASLSFNNAVRALAPGQPARWRGWAGLAAMALWMAWIGVYFAADASLDAFFAWGRPADDADALLRHAGLAFCAPLVLLLWGLRFFKLVKVERK
jgi:hypothetical protein